MGVPIWSSSISSFRSPQQFHHLPQKFPTFPQPINSRQFSLFQMNKKFLLSTIGLLLILCLPALTAAASSSNSKWAADLMWGNNTQWQMLAPPANGTAASGHSNNPAEELYFVAPQTSNPQTPADNPKLPGTAFDHVISIPPGNHGTYNANWHVYIVACASSACTGPDLTLRNGTTITFAQSVNQGNLTSDSAIDAGLSSGALSLVDTGVVFVCPVAPYNPGW